MLDSPPNAIGLALDTLGNRPGILIADDHLLIAEAFKSLLETEFYVVGIASDGRRLVESAIELQPDVVILDISMPHLNGLDAGAKIKAAKRDTKLIYVTAASGSDVAAEAFRRGASGYVLKHDGAEELRIAVRLALRGESYVSSLLDRKEIAKRLRPRAIHNPADKGVSRRQSEILQLLSEGKPMKEIAYDLQIKPGTVAFHKFNMMRHLEIKTTAGLIHYALRHHIPTKLK
jgi:DNA-binding NarL/FixJ family response regulator